MKEEESCLKWQFYFSFWPSFWPAFKRRMKAFAGAFKPSWNRGIKKFERSGAKIRPSFWVMAAGLTFAVSAFLALSPSENSDPWREKLLRSGWFENGEIPDCPEITHDGFFEVYGPDKTVEVYLNAEGKILGSEPSLPEGPLECRAIPQPSFVQELR